MGISLRTFWHSPDSPTTHWVVPSHRCIISVGPHRFCTLALDHGARAQREKGKHCPTRASLREATTRKKGVRLKGKENVNKVASHITRTRYPLDGRKMRCLQVSPFFNKQNSDITEIIKTGIRCISCSWTVECEFVTHTRTQRHGKRGETWKGQVNKRANQEER